MKKLEFKFGGIALTKAQMKGVIGGNEAVCPCGIETECDVLNHEMTIGLAQDDTTTTCHGVGNTWLQMMCDNVFYGTTTDGSCVCIPGSCGDS